MRSVKLLVILLTVVGCTKIKDLDLSSNLGLFWQRSSQVELSGKAIKGAVTGARVQVLPLVNNACDRTGATPAIAETITDRAGNYSIKYTKTGQPVCVLITPASGGQTKMYDETLKQELAWTNSSYYLDNVVSEPTGLTQRGLLNSPFSRMAARSFIKTMEKSDPSFANAVAKVSSRQVVSMFGLNRGIVKANNRSVGLDREREAGKRFGVMAKSRRQPSAEKAHRARDLSKAKSPGIQKAAKISRAAKNVKSPSSGVSKSVSGRTRFSSRNNTIPANPTLEDLQIDFNNPNDPITAKYLLVSSGMSALANKLATATQGKAIRSGAVTRDTATGDGIERVIDGFSEVIESGGKRSSILKDVFQKATGRNSVPSSFTKDPLEATMQTGITSYISESGGAAEYGITIAEIAANFEMSSTPPSDLMVDTGTAPDYLYYADNTDSGALLLYKGESEEYYPWVEGGLPTSFTVVSGTLPAGITLDPVSGDILGTPTAATNGTVTVKIQASNIHGNVDTTFKIRVIDPSQPFMQIVDDCIKDLYCESYFGLEVNGDFPFMTGVTATNLPAGFQILSDADGYYYITATDVSAITAGSYSVALSFTANGVSYTNQILNFTVYSLDDLTTGIGSGGDGTTTGGGIGSSDLLDYGLLFEELYCDVSSEVCIDYLGDLMSGTGLPLGLYSIPLTNASYSITGAPPGFTIDAVSGEIDTVLACTTTYDPFYTMTIAYTSDEGSGTLAIDVYLDNSLCGSTTPTDPNINPPPPTPFIDFGVSMLFCDADTGDCYDQDGNPASSIIIPTYNLTNPIFNIISGPPFFTVDPNFGDVTISMDCTEDSYYFLEIGYSSLEDTGSRGIDVFISTSDRGGAICTSSRSETFNNFADQVIYCDASTVSCEFADLTTVSNLSPLATGIGFTSPAYSITTQMSATTIDAGTGSLDIVPSCTDPPFSPILVDAVEGLVSVSYGILVYVDTSGCTPP